MNRTLLITGASSDLGLSLIESVYENYDTIIAHYGRNAESLSALKEKMGAKLRLMQADFDSDQDTMRFIEQVENAIDYPSHIVHLPAAKVKNINFHKSDWERVQSDINVSLRSLYKIMRRFIVPMARAKYGRIVLMLTSYTVQAEKFMLDYTTVKYALLGMMKSLAAEYADKSITVNAVSPSMIETKFLAEVPHLVIEQSARNNPQKRNAVVGDIIPAITFLLSDGASYITGQNIVISGGSVIQ